MTPGERGAENTGMRTSRHGPRILLAVVASAVLSVLAAVPVVTPDAHAGPPPDKPACRCVEGFGACQHFLRNPKGPTDDPCWCDRCDTGEKGWRHEGKILPSGWNGECFKSRRLDCYLKRHAAAWGIACSECIRLDDCCPFANDTNCPDCDASSAGLPVATDTR